jgi:DNA-binding NarL/FixJ family response regulator
MAGLVYRLHGSIVGEQLFGAHPAVLVTVTIAAAEPLTDEVLHAEYGLTTRETQVARLIAEGLSNSEIATRLGVRFFTARNHVERTLAKLGVGSRHRVGPLLRNEVPGSGDTNRASAA